LAEAVLVLATATTGASAQPRILPLGTLFPGYETTARAVSADGRVVVGTSTAADMQVHAFRWTSEEGMVDLGLFPGVASTQAYAVSGNGSVVAGGSVAPNGLGPGLLWTHAAGLTPFSMAGHIAPVALDISRDGRIVAGRMLQPNQLYRGFVMTLGQPPQELPSLPGGYASYAQAMTPDGRFVVGSASSSAGTRMVRWELGGPQLDLGITPGATSTHANSISADGNTVIGTASMPGNVTYAILWTSQGGLQDLGPLSDFSTIQLRALSGDGALAGGYAASGSLSRRAIIWRTDFGLSDANAYFADRRVNLAGWHLERINDMTPDGRTFVGQAAQGAFILYLGGTCGTPDFDNDGRSGTDADIVAFFACLGGNCCAPCGSADFDDDGDTGTDMDIEAFFRVLGGGAC